MACKEKSHHNNSIGNNITYQSGTAIAEFIEKNRCIRNLILNLNCKLPDHFLNFKVNKLGDNGIKPIGKALLKNKCITSLQLEVVKNEITNEGVKQLAHFIFKNKVIDTMTLNLSS